MIGPNLYKIKVDVNSIIAFIGTDGVLLCDIGGESKGFRVMASFAPSEVRSKQDNADAILGNGSLRRFNLIFDYTNKKLYLKPNTHFNDPFN